MSGGSTVKPKGATVVMRNTNQDLSALQNTPLVTSSQNNTSQLGDLDYLFDPVEKEKFRFMELESNVKEIYEKYDTQLKHGLAEAVHNRESQHGSLP